jgi:CelD/BcsL family acetyltransferase involved in cellulose biosynthesis
MRLSRTHALEPSDFFSGCLCDPEIDRSAARATRDKHPWCIRFVTVSQALESADIRAAWDMLIADSGNPDVLFQSPQWLSQLAAESNCEAAVAILEGDEGVVGVVPLSLSRTYLRWTVWGRTFLWSCLPSVAILGSQPLLPDDPRVLQQLLQAMAHLYPGRCVYFRRVMASSPLAQQIGLAAQGRWLVHATDDPQAHHFARLPASFEEFLGLKGRKSRARLRQLLKLSDASNSDRGTLICFQDSTQIDALLTMASEISRRSWQFKKLGERVSSNSSTRSRLQLLAEMGLLRAYVLCLANRPCAFLTGYQFNGVFHIDELGFDRRFAEDSPGITLLLHVLRDLIKDGRFRMLSFGDGHSPYKARFSNTQTTAAPILILPVSARTRAIAAAHRLFLRCRALLRNWSGNRPARTSATSSG